MEELTTVVQIINAVGTVGVLAWISWLFVNGRLISRDTLDTIMQRQDAMVKSLGAEMQENIASAVKEGMMRAFYEQNGKDGT